MRKALTQPHRQRDEIEFIKAITKKQIFSFDAGNEEVLQESELFYAFFMLFI